MVVRFAYGHQDVRAIRQQKDVAHNCPRSNADGGVRIYHIGRRLTVTVRGHRSVGPMHCGS